jgi:hypothetical protein
MEVIMSGYMYSKSRSASARRWLIALFAVVVAVAYMITPLPVQAEDTVKIFLDASPVTGYFNTSNWKYSKNTMYYRTEKEVNIQWLNTESLEGGVNTRIELECLDNGEWFPIQTSTKYVTKNQYTFSKKFEIDQYTPNVTSYRVKVPADGKINMADVYSPIFTVEGKKQTVGAVVKYSKSSQRYNKAPVEVTVSTTKAYSAKAEIYDGKKKLRTLTIKHGDPVTWKLPKKLKKGTHKISVKVTAMQEFAPFYEVYKSKTKKIKVK